MKTQWIRSIGCILAVLILSGIMPLAAQDNAERYTTISGVVKDKLNKKKLEYVNVSIPGSSVGTVTNADGEFTLKIPESVQAKDIEASHVGYLNSRIPLKEENPTERIVWLTPYANLLSEILVRARDPRSIVEEALRKIPANYSPQSNMLTGFYRELAQKGRRYINISEAVIDIYKTPYNETAEHDRVQIYRGRRLLSQKQSDTLAVKLLGGPNMAIYMDIVKNPDCLLAQEDLLFYEFRMEDPTSIDDRSQYVISFRPRVKLSYPLCYAPLRLYAASITGEPDVAEEIVEELFYVFWKDREKLEIFHSVKNYLYRSVRNRSIQYCEHQDVRRRYQDAILSVPVNIASPDPQEQIEYKELQQIINRTLEKLPERRLHIFRLHHTEGKKYSEIASLLSLSVKTVEKEMTRALRTLRKEIENYIQIS